MNDLLIVDGELYDQEEYETHEESIFHYIK